MKKAISTTLTVLGMSLGLALGISAPAHAIDNSATPHGDHRADAIAQQFTAGGNRHCTGVLIHPMWVITAAHCIKSSPTGSVGFGINGQHNRINYRTTLSHPDARIDVGLLKLERPAAAPTLAYNSDPGLIGWNEVGDIFGWGGHSAKRGTLGHAKARIEESLYTLNYKGTPTELTLANTMGGAFIVGGDSGGPLFMDKAPNTVAGITVYNNKGTPGKVWLIPTHLAAPWIAATTATSPHNDREDDGGLLGENNSSATLGVAAGSLG